MQVINKNFKDLTFIYVNSKNNCSQALVVYTETEDDRDFIMVR